MSRVGKQPIKISSSVKIALNKSLVTVEGVKGKLTFQVPPELKIEQKDNQLILTRDCDLKRIKSLHGTMRALLNNTIKGVTEGFKKELTIIGVGYKAQLKGTDLVLNIGFSHQIIMPIPQDLKVAVPIPTKIVVEGVDKQKVGQFSASVRRIYPPEPYKGKGIRYLNEEVRKKLGKALAK